MKPETKEKILKVTIGSQFGAVLRCAMNVERDAVPRFSGKAMVTSDGFVMCNFVGSDGQMRMGAFVGSKADLWKNVLGISTFLKLDKQDIADLTTLIDAWLGLEIIAVTGKPKTAQQVNTLVQRKHVLPGEMGGPG